MPNAFLPCPQYGPSASQGRPPGITEIEYDGYRVLVQREGGVMRLLDDET
jgi:hypothetical protein